MSFCPTYWRVLLLACVPVLLHAQTALPPLPDLSFENTNMPLVNQPASNAAADTDLLQLLDQNSGRAPTIQDEVKAIVTTKQPEDIGAVDALTEAEATAQAEALLEAAAKAEAVKQQKAKEPRIVRVGTPNQTSTRRPVNTARRPVNHGTQAPKIDPQRLATNTQYSLHFAQSLLDATAANDLSGVMALLKKGVAADVIDTHGNTPLMIATAVGNVEMIKTLLQAKSNINHRNRYGVSPLQLAILAGHTKLAQQYLALGANPNTADNLGSTPLVEAIYAQNLPMLQSLLARGANANIQDNNGNTMVHIAAMIGNVPIVQALMQAGVDARRANRQGITPMDIATFKRNGPIAQILQQNAGRASSRSVRTPAVGQNTLGPVTALDGKRTFSLPFKPTLAVETEALLQQWRVVSNMFGSLNAQQRVVANQKRLEMLNDLTYRTGKPGKYASYFTRLPKPRLAAIKQSMDRWEQWAAQSGQPLAASSVPRLQSDSASLSPQRAAQLQQQRQQRMQQAARSQTTPTIPPLSAPINLSPRTASLPAPGMRQPNNALNIRPTATNRPTISAPAVSASGLTQEQAKFLNMLDGLREGR